MRPSQRGRPARSKIIPARSVSGVRVARDPPGYGTYSDHLNVAVGVGAVHHTQRGDQDHLGGGFRFHPGPRVEGLPGIRVPVSQELIDHVGEALLGAANLVGIGAVGAVTAEEFHVAMVYGLAQVCELGCGNLGHQHSQAGPLHP